MLRAHCNLGSDTHTHARIQGGGVWHKASVSDCWPLAAPIGLSPLLILTLCGPERVLVVSTEPLDDLSCLTTPGSATGGGGGFSGGDSSGGENFIWGKFRHTSSFGAGPSDAGNFDTPNPWCLVDNQLCETLVCPNFEQYQLIRDKKTGARHKALTRGRGVMRVKFPQVDTVPRIASGAQITDCAQGAGGRGGGA